MVNKGLLIHGVKCPKNVNFEITIIEDIGKMKTLLVTMYF